MTPTSRSTKAGSEARAPLLRGFLRRANARALAGGRPFVLRGSLVLGALCPGARAAQDVDYLAPGPFDASVAAKEIAAIAALPDPSGATRIALERTAVIFGDSAFPGLRAFFTGESTAGEDVFQVDLGFGDPLSEPGRPIAIAEVGPTLACTAETLIGWKMHGLVEFGRGRWRPKDLYDAWLLTTRLALDEDASAKALSLAFTSRNCPLATLDDFLTRDSWGLSISTQRRWRKFVRDTPGVPSFAEARETVRAWLGRVLVTATRVR
jgi:hypothetical protein